MAQEAGAAGPPLTRRQLDSRGFQKYGVTASFADRMADEAALARQGFQRDRTEALVKAAGLGPAYVPLLENVHPDNQRALIEGLVAERDAWLRSRREVAEDG